jgi:sigma-B regulation protein RsbU (phosphoserine phosphatase)
MARRAGLSLGTKLILGTVLLIAAAVASSAWYGLSTLSELARTTGDARRTDLEKAIQRESELLTRNASASAASLLATSDYTRLEETARRLEKENPNVVWIALVEESGSIAASSENAPAKQGGRLDDELSKKLAGATVSAVESMPDPQNASVLLLGAPVFLADSSGKDVRVGMVRLAFDKSAGEKAKAEAIAQGRARQKASAQRQLIFAAILLIVALLLGGWQAMRISRPLRALSEQARHIAGGDFGRRVAVDRSDEIGELGESFNTMAASLGQLVEEIGRKAGLEREMEVARSIQGLMTPPPEMVTVGDFRLMGRCEMASACGGDWWSYRQLPDGRLLLVVGDVTGHGMPSAMIAATGRGAVESLAFLDTGTITPALVLQAIDRAIRDVGGKRLLMTCFAMILGSDGIVHYANAGHTFPYVMCDIKGANPGLEVLPVRSNPLGSNRPHIAEGNYQLGNGDFMVLTSDGLTDRVSSQGTRFGEKRLRKTLVEEATRGTHDVRALCERIVTEVNVFGGEQPVDDDITLVVVQYTGTASSGVSTSRRLRGAPIKRGAAA